MHIDEKSQKNEDDELCNGVEILLLNLNKYYQNTKCKGHNAAETMESH